VLVKVVVILVALDIAANLYLQARPGPDTAALTRLFLLDSEGNIPTYFSSVLLGLSALVLTLAALSARHQHQRFANRWLFLGLVFAYLSMDEIVQIHERWDVVIRRLIGDPTLSGGWVIVAAGLVVLSAGIWLPLFLSQPARIRALWVLAGAMYVAGALGVEIIAKPYQPAETASLGYLVFVALEEALEMFGASLFLYSLLVSLQPAAAGSRAFKVTLQPADPPRNIHGGGTSE
jgi:hypothetical protein